MDLIDRIIDDPLFYRWVFDPDECTTKVWEDFMRQNPHYVDQLLALKEKLNQIHIAHKKLKEKEKQELARNIIRQTIEKRSPKIRAWYINSLRYAAIILFAFGVGGTLSYFIFHDSGNFIVAPEMNSLSQISVPMLILPEGESVDLEEKESKIDYSEKGKILLNGNKVISAEKETTENKINQVVIPYGNRSEITLSDNTVVHINAGSRLVYPSHFDTNKREVYLFGEAFFSVVEDAKHPFVVHTSDISVQVLGTKFNLCAYPEDNIIQAVLAEGSISLRKKDAGLFEDDIVLHPNQMASYSKTDQNVQVKDVDVSFYTLWKDGVIKFSNTDLNRVLKRIERFYNVRFIYENPFDAGIKISGKLNLKEEKEEVFGYISKVALVKIEHDKGNKYTIR